MSRADNPHSITALKTAAASAVSTLTRRKAKATPAPSFLDPTSIKDRFYGLTLSGHCLDPVLKDGDRIAVDQEAPLRAGDFAVLYKRPDLVPPGENPLSLKKLVTAMPPWVRFPWKDNPGSDVVPILIVEMFNPRKQWSVNCCDLLAVHRCLGRADDPEVQARLAAEGWAVQL